ncbi:MAG: F0F1 ATP synthase subunit A [Firmicutes bacterium]|nr:F0F1 ATP synthase subunit A [Bacillota bacterium]
MAAGDYDPHSQDILTRVHHELNFWGFPHGPVDLFGLGAMNLKTIVMTWVVMILVIIFTVLATRNMQLRRPGKMQLMVEEVFRFLRGLAVENLGVKKANSMMLLVFSLFIYLLFCNLWGLVPTMMSPTADPNTTLGMSVSIFILAQLMGLYYKGFGYFKHFVQPFVFFLPINIVEELSKPLTHGFRIYGNIYAGEVLIAVLLGLIPLTATILGGFTATVVWLSFSIFVGTVQAFIFTMLTIVYVSMAAADHH